MYNWRNAEVIAWNHMDRKMLLEIVTEIVDVVHARWKQLEEREEQRKREEEQKKAAAAKEAAAKLGDEPERYLNRMFTEMGWPEPFPYLSQSERPLAKAYREEHREGETVQEYIDRIMEPHVKGMKSLLRGDDARQFLYGVMAGLTAKQERREARVGEREGAAAGPAGDVPGEAAAG